MPFGDLVDSGHLSVSSRNQGVDDRPEVRARNTLARVLLNKTFQSSRGVETALGMLSVKKCWTQIAKEMGGSDPPETLTTRLNGIVKKRNMIVHEGDLARQSRPRNIKRHQHHSVEVEDDLDWLAALIAAIDKVVANT